MPFCPRCGRYTRSELGIRFCPYCGAYLYVGKISNNAKRSIIKDCGIILDNNEQVLLNVGIEDSYVPISESREKTSADAIWLRPFGLFNYLFAVAEKSGDVNQKYIFSGRLIITNKRIIIIEQQGFLTSKLVPISFIDLKSVRAISISKNFFRGSSILVTYETQTKTLHTMELHTSEKYEHLISTIHEIRELLKNLLESSQ